MGEIRGEDAKENIVYINFLRSRALQQIIRPRELSSSSHEYYSKGLSDLLLSVSISKKYHHNNHLLLIFFFFSLPEKRYLRNICKKKFV